MYYWCHISAIIRLSCQITLQTKNVSTQSFCADKRKIIKMNEKITFQSSTQIGCVENKYFCSSIKKRIVNDSYYNNQPFHLESKRNESDIELYIKILSNLSKLYWYACKQECTY